MNLERLLPRLEGALRAERDGYAFYASAAQRSEDPGAKEVFGHLAAEERRHFEALQAEYRALLEGATWDGSVSLGERWAPPEGGGIFSPDFRRRIAGQHLEMSALSIGILLEKSAEAFYRDAAAEETDARIRSFLLELAEWEAGHLRMLMREDEELRNAYWNENRFSPLL
jgi:rubrerythrin